jgi:hypothetical protein
MPVGRHIDERRLIQHWRFLAERNMSEGREELEAAKTEDDPELKKLLEESGALGMEAGQRMLDWCEKQESKFVRPPFHPSISPQV